MQAIRSGWWVVVVSVVLATAVAGALTWTAAPQYASSTRLFVTTAAAPDVSAAYQGNLFSQQRVASYAELLTGEQLAARVVDELDLELSPREVAAMVTAAPVEDTVILHVTVRDTSPERAQAIAASLARQFTRQVAELETPNRSLGSMVKVTTVKNADFDPTPVSPDPVRNLPLGALLGLLCGTGLVLLRSRLDSTVKTVDDVADVAGVAVIGTVLEDPHLSRAHVVTNESISAEDYRAIRTNLQFLDVDRPPRVIVISSAVAGEGKSTLAVNLSVVLAKAGNRVVLVEADLRRPRVTRYMGLVSGAGLTNVLAGSADLEDVVQSSGEGDLAVLAAGPTPPNPSELLGSAQMRDLLADLRETYDFVLVDAPPLLPVTDAAVLAMLADGCVLSTRFGTTRREELAEAAAALSRIGARLLGVVLNRVPVSRRGYGYGYEADPERRPAGRGDRRGWWTGRRRAGRSRAAVDSAGPQVLRPAVRSASRAPATPGGAPAACGPRTGPLQVAPPPP